MSLITEFFTKIFYDGSERGLIREGKGGWKLLSPFIIPRCHTMEAILLLLISTALERWIVQL
ncbi:hypothetical protein EDM59_19185 [Brevibacillus nitrificans]|uniref:Uncharacterized protein n=1 Tax=Brevibacillus nitrificans TaxID=651560 RepID=A0A3M8D6C2_9BACL|nr:hypothetical protein EDM59_19185 [Brevibacillus nitrificans]